MGTHERLQTGFQVSGESSSGVGSVGQPGFQSETLGGESASNLGDRDQDSNRRCKGGKGSGAKKRFYRKFKEQSQYSDVEEFANSLDAEVDRLYVEVGELIAKGDHTWEYKIDEAEDKRRVVQAWRISSQKLTEKWERKKNHKDSNSSQMQNEKQGALVERVIFSGRNKGGSA